MEGATKEDISVLVRRGDAEIKKKKTYKKSNQVQPAEKHGKRECKSEF